MEKMQYRMSSWEAGKEMRITGYAVVFDQRTVLYRDPETGYDYGEIIDSNALDRANLNDVILRYNHEGHVLARTRNGSLTLRVDKRGLFVEADLSGSEEARRFYEEVKMGLLDKMSFAFDVAADVWDEKSRTRRISKINRLYDVSIVAFPAYEQTQVEARHAEEFALHAEQDRKDWRERHTSLDRVEIEKRMAVMGLRGSAADYMTKEDLSEAKKRDSSLPMLARGRYDEREPIYREMLEIRSNWIEGDLEKADKAKKRFAELENELKAIAEKRFAAAEKVSAGGGVLTKDFIPHAEERKNNMENIELRAFKKFVSEGTMQNLTVEERAGLTTSGAGAVMPVEIFNHMITNSKYSDLLNRARVMNISGAGTVKVPIASNVGATWKAELAAVDPTAPTLTSLDLGGKELMRAIQFSAAVDAMSFEEFSTWMADLCASEVVETLEEAFITAAAGTDAPHNGLQKLTWTKDSNAVEAATTITAADVAKGLSLLPQKYARNAILLMNANTAYNTVGLFKGTSEYAYSMADGATRFMAKEIHISEYCEDNAIYIIDPAQLYVRFAMPPVIEVDRSVGFLSAANTMRCLTVVDFAWNTAAAVRVGVKG